MICFGFRDCYGSYVNDMVTDEYDFKTSIQSSCQEDPGFHKMLLSQVTNQPMKSGINTNITPRSMWYIVFMESNL